jgi:hypothetical protein
MVFSSLNYLYVKNPALNNAILIQNVGFEGKTLSLKRKGGVRALLPSHNM